MLSHQNSGDCHEDGENKSRDREKMFMLFQNKSTHERESHMHRRVGVEGPVHTIKNFHNSLKKPFR